MNGADPGARVPGWLLRGSVAVLGLLALAVAVSVLVAAAALLARDPQTPAEAHAMAHSAPGILVAVLLWTGGGCLVGGILLAVAYVDRRWLSAVALVATGSLGALLSLERGDDRLAAVALAPVALGGYALYEAALDRGPLAFLAAVTALLWLGQLLGFVAVSFGFGWLLGPTQLLFLALWSRWLLGVGAGGILALALRYRQLGVPVPRAPLALAAALLVTHLPDAVWAALSPFVVAGLGPLEWVQILVATGSTVAILVGPLARSVRRRS